MYQNSCFCWAICVEMPELTTCMTPYRCWCHTTQHGGCAVCVYIRHSGVIKCACVGHKPLEHLPECACLQITTIYNTLHERRNLTAICSPHTFHLISVLRFQSYGMWRRTVWHIATKFRWILLSPIFVTLNIDVNPKRQNWRQIWHLLKEELYSTVQNEH